jgi:hypothetical protein
MTKRALIAAATAGALLSGSLLGAGAILSEANQSSVKVCVNKSTKVMKYKATCGANERTLRLSLRGETGKSAYQIWLAQGFRGTETDFLNFLRGAPGVSIQDFARTCYQQLQKATAQGLFWNNLRDRRDFERRTGCVVRDINLNPNAHAPSEEPIWPQVLSSTPLGLYGGAGGGFAGGQFSETRDIFFEANVRLPSEWRACSAAVQGASRALYSADLGELYLQGTVNRTLTGLVSEIAVGFGEFTDEVIYPESDQGVRDIQVGGYTVMYLAPWAIPLDEDVEISILEVLQEGDPVDLDDILLTLRLTQGEGLAQLEEVTTIDGAIKTYRLGSNPREYGSVKLEIGLVELSFGHELTADFEVGMGVNGCTSEVLNDAFGPYSWLFQIHEDPAVLELGSAEPMLDQIGWIYPDWFQ